MSNQSTTTKENDDAPLVPTDSEPSPPPSIRKKRKKKHNIMLTDTEKGKHQERTLRILWNKHVHDRIFGFKPPDDTLDTLNKDNILEKYSIKDKWIDRLVKMRLIEPRGNWKQRERDTMKQKGLIQTNLGTARIGRALSTADQVKRKYGAKTKATKEYLYTEVHKYYKVFGGMVTMRHWRVEEWLGIPVKVWIFVYLMIAGAFAFAVTYYYNTPRLIENNKQIAQNEKTTHIPLVIDKLRQNQKIMEHLGSIDKPKLSKLAPADRNNFRARHVHELWADSENEGLIRIVVIYDTEQSLEGICRLEIHLDTEIIKIDFEDEMKRDLNRLTVVRCPPDLFPLMHWFTQSRRELFAYIPYYIWPIAPVGCLLALARWHYRTPPGLANYVLDQLQSHVIVRRALGSPVHLQSDQWKGRLTSRSCNMRVLLEGTKHTGKVNVIGYRDGSTRWLFPNAVLMIDGVKHDHFREIYITPFQIPTST